MGIGIHEHVAYQDSWFYPREVYQDLILDLEEREPNPWRQAVCLVLKNNNTRCVSKSADTWDQPGYYGE